MQDGHWTMCMMIIPVMLVGLGQYVLMSKFDLAACLGLEFLTGFCLYWRRAGLSDTWCDAIRVSQPFPKRIHFIVSPCEPTHHLMNVWIDDAIAYLIYLVCVHILGLPYVISFESKLTDRYSLTSVLMKLETIQRSQCHTLTSLEFPANLALSI